MKLLGANPAPESMGIEPLPGKSHYFIGNDPKKWRTDIPNYSRVIYRDVYPGIDIVYYGKEGQLEYDLIVGPGGDPSLIRLAFEGADKLEIDAEGNLVLQVGQGQILLRKPFLYQEVDGQKKEIHGGYILSPESKIENQKSKINVWTVGFQIAQYDATRPLVIDPVLAYSTYLGGIARDIGNSIALDAAGNIYVTGQTESPDFPTANPLQPNNAGLANAFVTKLDSTGATLVYSTYLGGSLADRGNSIAVDGEGNAYITGRVSSDDFPITPGVPIPSFRGGMFDAFVAKLNAQGNALLYSTYLGGSGNDAGFAIAVDSGGNAYATGGTRSDDFPVQNALQPSLSGALDAYVTKLDPTGSTLTYSTYLGGSGNDRANGIAVDGVGNAYVTGHSESIDFPTANAFQPNNAGGRDAVVTKLNAEGNALLYSTYLGGSSEDSGAGIAVDALGNAYVTGYTDSTEFPTANAFQPANGGFRDALVTKFNVEGNDLVYSTYLGGSGSENLVAEQGEGATVGAIALDASGGAYVTGATRSTNFPTANAIQPTYGGGLDDAFVTKLSPEGNALVYSSFLGGGSSDVGAGIAVDSSGTVFVTGSTDSTDLPTANPLQPSLGGDVDAFIAKIADTPVDGADLAITMSDLPDPVAVGDNLTYTIVITNNGPLDATGVILTDTLPGGVTFVSATPTQGSCSEAGGLVTCDLGSLAAGASATAEIVVSPTETGEISNTAFVMASEPDPDPANNPATEMTTVNGVASSDLWVFTTDFPDSVTVGDILAYTIYIGNNGPVDAASVVLTDTLVGSMTFLSATPTQGGCSEAGGLVTCDLGSLAAGASATAEIVVSPTETGEITSTATVVGNEADPDPTNNSATETTTVVEGAAADLSVIKTDFPDPVTLGDYLTYTIDITNNGLWDATGVVLTDALPGGVTFLSATPTQGSCGEAGGLVTCDLGSLVVGAPVTAEIVVFPIEEGEITSTATVAGNEVDSDPTNNSATAMTIVVYPSSSITSATLNRDRRGTEVYDRATLLLRPHGGTQR